MTDIVDSLLDRDEPRRIYGWMDSQLSIARFSGGCRINGTLYAIRYDLDGQPLEEVRAKPKRARKKAKDKAA